MDFKIFHGIKSQIESQIVPSLANGSLLSLVPESF
jgi:hypothetical protein